MQTTRVIDLSAHHEIFLMKHPDDEVFAAFAFGDLPAPERAEVEGHMRDCESCRNSLVNIAEIESLLADESLFTLADAMNARAETPLSLAQFALDLERERTEARELVGHALDSPVDFVAAKVAKQERFARVEVVRLLIRRSAEILQDDPKFALLVSSAAVQLAVTLARSRDRFDYSLLGTALKERATGLRFTGRHAEALDVLERAERAFKSDPKTLPYDLAVVWVNRAAVLAESDRADDAAKLARSAAAILREFGDTTHAASARMIEASGFYFSQRRCKTPAAHIGNLATSIRLRHATRRLSRSMTRSATHHKGRACGSLLLPSSSPEESFVKRFPRLPRPAKNSRDSE